MSAQYFFYSQVNTCTELPLVCTWGSGPYAGTIILYTQKHAVRRLPDIDEDGSSVISSLWTSAFALGNFLGPTVGDLLWIG